MNLFAGLVPRRCRLEQEADQVAGFKVRGDVTLQH